MEDALRIAWDDICKAYMPFGKHKGLRLVDLPEPYVVWFSKKGFPKGKLGEQLQLVYDIKVNGLEHLFNGKNERKKEGSW